MRRRGLLIVLWLVGTVVATTVVFQAVRVMTDNLGARSSDANNPGRALPSTTTIGRPAGATTSTQTTAAVTTADATTTVPEPTTEPTTASSETAPEPAPGGSIGSAGGGSRPATPGSTVRGQVTQAPPATQAPAVTPAPTAPPATNPPPTNPPETAPPTAPPTPPTTTARSSAICTPALPIMHAGKNLLGVDKCVETYPVTRVYAANPRVNQDLNYSFNVVSRGPAVVVVTFSGANTYICRAGPDGNGDWFQGCDPA